MATKKPTYADLSRTILELRAQMPGSLKSAMSNLDKADNRMMASAVVVTITALGGRPIVQPFAITDGLSADSIAALKCDIRHSLKLMGVNHGN